jgi:hypothetical protein
MLQGSLDQARHETSKHQTGRTADTPGGRPPRLATLGRRGKRQGKEKTPHKGARQATPSGDRTDKRSLAQSPCGQSEAQRQGPYSRFKCLQPTAGAPAAPQASNQGAIARQGSNTSRQAHEKGRKEQRHAGQASGAGHSNQAPTPLHAKAHAGAQAPHKPTTRATRPAVPATKLAQVRLTGARRGLREQKQPA